MRKDLVNLNCLLFYNLHLKAIFVITLADEVKVTEATQYSMSQLTSDSIYIFMTKIIFFYLLFLIGIHDNEYTIKLRFSNKN